LLRYTHIACLMLLLNSTERCILSECKPDFAIDYTTCVAFSVLLSLEYFFADHLFNRGLINGDYLRRFACSFILSDMSIGDT
jgi:hypothetical protein